MFGYQMWGWKEGESVNGTEESIYADSGFWSEIWVVIHGFRKMGML